MWPRATIQARTNGALEATTSTMSSRPNVCQAFTASPPPAPASLEWSFAALVPNEGRNSDPTSTSEAPQPAYSASVRRLRSR